jgi:hypothetical protein
MLDKAGNCAAAQLSVASRWMCVLSASCDDMCKKDKDTAVTSPMTHTLMMAAHTGCQAMI